MIIVIYSLQQNCNVTSQSMSKTNFNTFDDCTVCSVTSIYKNNSPWQQQMKTTQNRAMTYSCTHMYIFNGSKSVMVPDKPPVQLESFRHYHVYQYLHQM